MPTALTALTARAHRARWSAKSITAAVALALHVWVLGLWSAQSGRDRPAQVTVPERNAPSGSMQRLVRVLPIRMSPSLPKPAETAVAVAVPESAPPLRQNVVSVGQAAALALAAPSAVAAPAAQITPPASPPTHPPADPSTDPRTDPRSDLEGDASLASASAISPADGVMPPQALPVYATRAPDPIRLRYALQWGIAPAARSGEAELSWQHDGARYRLMLDGLVGASKGRSDRATPLVQQTSSGGFDIAGLAPERFVDQRRGQRGRREYSAHFSRELPREEQRIRFSGPRIVHPAWPGTQDRLGWIAQLAAIALAAGAVPPEVSMFVVDGRGYGQVWTFAQRGLDDVATPLGTVQAVKLQREPQRPHDWRVEAWLDPQRSFWPARVRMSLPLSGAAFELHLLAEPTVP